MTYVNGIKLNKVHKCNVNTNHKILSAFGVDIPFRICFNTKALTVRWNYVNEVPFDSTAIGNKAFTSYMEVGHWLKDAVLVNTDRPIFLH